MNLPEGYGSVSASGVTAFAVASAMEWLESTIGSGETLYAWGRAAPGREDLQGRGTVFSVPAAAPGPDASARWAVRHYQRGGALASLLEDRYLAVGDPRPLQEAMSAAILRARGVPTPAVVAGAVYREGLFYRADLVTELVPDAVDLAGALFGESESRDRKEDGRLAMQVAGRLLARLGATGVHHADLNAKNILLRTSSEALHAYVLDLDRCRLVTPGLTVGHGAMRRRLERSLRKLEIQTGQELSGAEWDALRDGWAGG